MKVTESNEWKWLPGMLELNGYRFIRMNNENTAVFAFASGLLQSVAVADVHPDLTDPATQGAIIFGIFQSLGIGIVHGELKRGGPDGARGEIAFGVLILSPNAHLYHLAGEAFASLPELITAVFASLDGVDG